MKGAGGMILTVLEFTETSPQLEEGIRHGMYHLSSTEGPAPDAPRVP